MSDSKLERPYATWLAQSEWAVWNTEGAPSGEDPAPWWFRDGVDAFEERLKDMGSGDVQQLRSEVRGMLSYCHTQQGSRAANPERHLGLGKIIAELNTKRRIIGGFLREKRPVSFSQEERVGVLAEARRDIAAGNDRAALLRVIDLLTKVWSPKGAPEMTDPNFPFPWAREDFAPKEQVQFSYEGIMLRVTPTGERENGRPVCRIFCVTCGKLDSVTNRAATRCAAHRAKQHPAPGEPQP